jgi:cellulase/cellobiase CelA1
VSWTFANGQTIGQLWSGSFTQPGGAVAVTNMTYNGGLAPRAATSFGFTAGQPGPNPCRRSPVP